MPLRLLCCNKMSSTISRASIRRFCKPVLKTEYLRTEFEKCQNKSLQATEENARTLAQTESNQSMPVLLIGTHPQWRQPQIPIVWTVAAVLSKHADECAIQTFD